MTKQRREGEANGPPGQRPTRASRAGPSWAEFVRLAHQAVVAIGGAGTTNRAEPRAGGHRRGPRRLDPEPRAERTARTASNGAGGSRGRAQSLWAGTSKRMGENSLYGMMRGGGGNVSLIWRPFATRLERADTPQAAGLNWARLRSTLPIVDLLAGLQRYGKPVPKRGLGAGDIRHGVATPPRLARAGQASFVALRYCAQPHQRLVAPARTRAEPRGGGA